MRKVEIDWAALESMDQMWDETVARSGHPDWHGRNLDALNDGWVAGGLDEHGPPYEFVSTNCEQISEALQEVAKVVMEIADDSVRENGGTVKRG